MKILRRHWLDVFIVFAAVEAALEVALRDDPTQAPTTSHWFAVPAAALIVLPLLFRRRHPFAAPATLWVVAAAVSFVDGRLVTFAYGLVLGGLAAAYMLGNLRDERQGRLGLAIVLGATVVLVTNDPNHSTSDVFLQPILFALAWVAGFALRERGVQAEIAEERALHAERERDAAARVAVAEERARIARELHDIVAHSISVMVLQVGAVRHRLGPGDSDDAEALRAVEQTGRDSLTEMRRLLGALRRSDEEAELGPQPGLGRLEALLEEVRRAGLPVSLQVTGEPFALPSGLDLSAYRIVQEGLTNSLKHADASNAEVVIRYEPEEVGIDVRDDGRGASGGDGDLAGGHGLVGIRERVKIYGGEMTAGAANGGGFVLRARLPLGQERS